MITRIAAEVVLTLDKPKLVKQQGSGRLITVDRVKWSVAAYGDGRMIRDCRAFGDDYRNAEVAGAWVPLPPDGWDAAVVAFHRSLAEAVSA